MGAPEEISFPFVIHSKHVSDALNDLQIKISGDLEKSSGWEIDLLPMRFQLAGKNRRTQRSDVQYIC